MADESDSTSESVSIEKVQPLAVPLDMGSLIANGEFGRADLELKRRLLAKPDDSESLFWMARIKSEQGQLSEAVQLLDAIPMSDVAASNAALGQAAQWLEEMEQWGEAVQRYQKLLQRVPDAPIVLRPLARILNRQGRRTEASRLVTELCRQGNIEEEELRSLLTWSHAFASDDPEDPFAAIGELGKARMLFSLAEYQKVVDLLRPLASDSNAAVYSLYGRALALLQDVEAMTLWQGNPVPGCVDQADYWYARGLDALLKGDAGGGVVDFSEAIVRDPTDHTAYVRYGEALARTGMLEASRLASQRAELLRKTNEMGVDFARGHRDAQRFASLAELLDQLDRPYEALAWRAISLAYDRESIEPRMFAQLQNDLQKRREQIEQAGVEPSEPRLLCGLLRNELRARFPRPSRPKEVAFRSEVAGPQRSLGPLAVCDVAKDIGLVHTFDNVNASSPSVQGILQEMGSGVAVTDYDLDGRPDIYLPQGAATPMQQDGVKPNLLYRNLGDRFEVTTSSAMADDRSFSQGATAGDVNQDGFPDLCIANVGHNRLLINNGDGTFTSIMLSTDESRPLWTSSIAIGDLSGDHLPDIVEVNYIDDPTAFERHGSPRAFGHAIDRVYFGTVHGEFKAMDLGDEPSSGLGVVLTDLDGDSKNEVFITNDGVPDRLWQRTGAVNGQPAGAFVSVPVEATPDELASQLCERALARGCAVGFQGLAGASMGIAVDDFNTDGRLDLFVTQFYQEPDVFYFQTDDGAFVDRCVQVGTYEPSLQVLGFGTQSIDMDNDSFVEIAVLNGHTARSTSSSIPYEMLPQLYRRDSTGKYAEVKIIDSSNYWHTRVLGRGLSKLDWNRDGLMDLVATHLDAPTALIENRVATKNAWIELRLVGTTSERDTIGARVTVQTEDFKRCNTVNSGDGYGGKNEAVLHFGLAESKTADVRVQWPAGETSDFRIPKLNQRWLIIEGDDQAYDDRIATN